MSKKSAHVTSEVFMTWLKDRLFRRKHSGKVLNILDGKSPHVSDIDILNFANENDIDFWICSVIRLTTYSR
jgi:hypothetical protein